MTRLVDSLLSRPSYSYRDGGGIREHPNRERAVQQQAVYSTPMPAPHPSISYRPPYSPPVGAYGSAPIQPHQSVHASHAGMAFNPHRSTATSYGYHSVPTPTNGNTRHQRRSYAASIDQHSVDQPVPLASASHVAAPVREGRHNQQSQLYDLPTTPRSASVTPIAPAAQQIVPSGRTRRSTGAQSSSLSSVAPSDSGKARVQRKLQRIKEELAHEERLAAEAKAFKSAYSHHRAAADPRNGGLHQVASNLVGSLPDSNDAAQRAPSRRMIYTSDLQDERYPRLPACVPIKKQSLKPVAVEPVEAVPYTDEVRPAEEPRDEEALPAQKSTVEALTEEAALPVETSTKTAETPFPVEATHPVEPAHPVEAAHLSEPALPIEATLSAEPTYPIEVPPPNEVFNSVSGTPQDEDVTHAEVVPQAGIAPQAEEESEAELAPQTDPTPVEPAPPAVEAATATSTAPPTPELSSSRFEVQVSLYSGRSMTADGVSENIEIASDRSPQSSRPSTPCVQPAVVPEPLALSCKEVSSHPADGQPDQLVIDRGNTQLVDSVQASKGDVVHKNLGSTTVLPVQNEERQEPGVSSVAATTMAPSTTVVQPITVQGEALEPPASLLPPSMTPTSTLAPPNADMPSTTEDQVAPVMVTSATVFTDAKDGSEARGNEGSVFTEAEEEATSMRRSSSKGTVFIDANDGSELLGTKDAEPTQADEDGVSMQRSASEGTIFFESFTGEEKRPVTSVQADGSSIPQNDAVLTSETTTHQGASTSVQAKDRSTQPSTTDASVGEDATATARRRAAKGPKLISVAPVQSPESPIGPELGPSVSSNGGIMDRERG